MKINRDNYEAYFLDFVEGNLLPSQKSELDLFLTHHPELKLELDDFEIIHLEAEPLSNYPFKRNLKKEETTGLNEIDYLLISEVEGTSNKEEKEKLAALMLEDKLLVKELAYYSKSKLRATDKLVFPNKSALIKKPTKLIYFYRYSAAVAATILALVYFNINNIEGKYEPRTAQQIAIEELERDNIRYAYVVADDIEKPIADERLPVSEKKNYANLNSKPIIELPIIQKEEAINVALEEIIVSEEELAATIKEKEEVVLPVDNQLANAKEKEETPVEKEFVPINEFARKLLLKDKSVSEALADELAEVSKDKINFEQVKNKKGKTEQFALNIGKFSISRNK